MEPVVERVVDLPAQSAYDPEAPRPVAERSA
jgi:hypothetical protein